MTCELHELARPAEDGSDTEVLDRLMTAAQNRPKQRLERRSFLRGSVALNYGYTRAYTISPWMVPAPFDHPSFHEAEKLLALWPAAFQQASTLLEFIHPSVDLRLPALAPAGSMNSSHSLGGPLLRSLWTTVNDALGLAENIVHELAHQKLRAIGIPVLGESPLVANPVDATYWSFIKKKPRPMTAVLHALYSFTHVAELHDRVSRAGRGPYRAAAQRNRLFTRDRIRNGREVVSASFVPRTAEAAAFVAAMVAWTTDVERRLADDDVVW